MGVLRIDLICMLKVGAGYRCSNILDMARRAIQDKVSHALTNDELDHIFDTDRTFMD